MIILSIIFISIFTFAELDSGSQQALEQTKALLQNQESRQKAAKDSPEATKAYENAKNLMGSEQGTDNLFGLSSEIFEYLAKSTGGDSKKMNELLQKAATDPVGFANSLPPHLKQKIKATSKNVPASNPSN